MYQIN